MSIDKARAQIHKAMGLVNEISEDIDVMMAEIKRLRAEVGVLRGTLDSTIAGNIELQAEVESLQTRLELANTEW